MSEGNDILEIIFVQAEKIPDYVFTRINNDKNLEILGLINQLENYRFYEPSHANYSDKIVNVKTQKLLSSTVTYKDMIVKVLRPSMSRPSMLRPSMLRPSMTSNSRNYEIQIEKSCTIEQLEGILKQLYP